MDIPRRSLDPNAYRQLYVEVSSEWLANNPSFPRSQGKEKQEEFYDMVDVACASLKTVPQDDWREIIRICCAAQAGAQAVVTGEFQFPEDSPLRVAICSRVAANCKVFTVRRTRARQEAAGGTLDITSSAMSMYAPEALGLSIDESVTYIRPGTNEVAEFTVVGFGKSKTRGRWFRVAYLDNPDVEVELSEQEVKEMLIMRVEID